MIYCGPIFQFSNTMSLLAAGLATVKHWKQENIAIILPNINGIELPPRGLFLNCPYFTYGDYYSKPSGAFQSLRADSTVLLLLSIDSNY